MKIDRITRQATRAPYMTYKKNKKRYRHLRGALEGWREHFKNTKVVKALYTNKKQPLLIINFHLVHYTFSTTSIYGQYQADNSWSY